MFDLVLILAVSRFLALLYCDLSDFRRLYVWIGMAPSCK